MKSAKRGAGQGKASMRHGRRQGAEAAAVRPKIKPMAGMAHVSSEAKPIKFFTFKRIVEKNLDPALVIRTVRKGLPAKSIDDAVAYIDVPQKDLLAALRIPVSTFHRKLAANATLSPPDSEKVVRLAEITRHAEQTFGNDRTAREWLTTENLILGAAPLSLIDTEAGAAQVRRVLSNLDYGGVA